MVGRSVGAAAKDTPEFLKSWTPPSVSVVLLPLQHSSLYFPLSQGETPTRAQQYTLAATHCQKKKTQDKRYVCETIGGGSKVNKKQIKIVRADITCEKGQLANFHVAVVGQRGNLPIVAEGILENTTLGHKEEVVAKG